MTKVSTKAPPHAPSDASSARELISAIADLVSLVEPRLLEVWRLTGMTFTQRRLLRQLREGPRFAGEVATSLGISGPSLTRQLAKLEERGYISRTIDTGDRRRIQVELTVEGRTMLADHRVFAGSPLARASRDLTAGRRQDLVENLSLLVGLARELEPGNPDE